MKKETGLEFGIWRNRPDRRDEKRRASRRGRRRRRRSITGRPPVTVASWSSGSNSPSRFCFSYPPWACSKIQIRNLSFSLSFSLSWVRFAFVSLVQWDGIGQAVNLKDLRHNEPACKRGFIMKPYDTAGIFFNGWIDFDSIYQIVLDLFLSR